MNTVDINENVELCRQASFSDDAELYAKISDVELIQSKIPFMDKQTKARALETIKTINAGNRRYTGGVFEPRSERKRIL